MDWRHLHAMRRCVVGLCTETIAELEAMQRSRDLCRSRLNVLMQVAIEPITNAGAKNVTPPCLA